MWPLFFLACLLALVVIYLPGALALRALGLRIEDAIACAPLYGIAFLAINAMVLPYLGIPASLLALVGPMLVFGAAAYAMASARRRRTAGDKASATPDGDCIQVCGHGVPAWSVLVVYGIVGVALCCLTFVRNLGDPQAFVQEFDNCFHLAAIRTYLSTGNFSSSSSFYYVPGGAMPLVSQAGFYPSAWHDLCALVAQTLSAPVTLAVNAVNATLVGVVFPVSAFFLLRKAFPGGDSVVVAGLSVAPCFACFPWDFLTFGPLYPNLLTNTLVPLGVGAFVVFAWPGGKRGVRLRMLVVFILACVAQGLSQPNGIFTMAALLAAYVVWAAMRAARLAREAGRRAPAPLAAGVIAFFAVGLIWAGCYKLPMLRAVVTFDYWQSSMGVRDGALAALSLGMNGHPAQWALAVLVILGAVLAVIDRSRDHWWLAVSWAFILICFVIDVSTEGLIKRLTCGFWYADPHRIAANLSLAAVPLAAFGLSWLGEKASCLLRRAEDSVVPLAVGAAALLVVSFPAYLPTGSTEGSTAFANLGVSVVGQSDLIHHPLTAEEFEFSREALAAIPEGSLVINESEDGSVYLYPLLDANIYYRAISFFDGSKNETAESLLIRHHLYEYASRQDVRDAVASIGARYVLVLDQGPDEGAGRRRLLSYDPEQWDGIEGITDGTPGFKVILARDDMRLYEIEG
ncbi:DUF6541 family protein [Olsenella sp. Marseille-P4559]|uniref:DUF6541 family protein n=1 Tax=Olsenella sp. Marseille-P4559 TaxID=2364795 RepID=UPI001031C4C0|nr:DUF6541 family protein [Olsenella sp. Marseille-P4559]